MRRRQFLAAPAMVAAAQTPARNTGIIDCQSHLFVPDLISWMEKRKSQSPYVYRKGYSRCEDDFKDLASAIRTSHETLIAAPGMKA